MTDMKKEQYFMGESDKEVQRLAKQHRVFRHAMGGKLVLAPVDLEKKGLRVLDSGAANGHWLSELMESLPASVSSEQTYVGTDISTKMFPPCSSLPPNLHLQAQSVTLPWPADLKGSFDLVHQRLVLASSGALPLNEVIANLVSLLKPGGWIQFGEADFAAEGYNIKSGPAVKDFTQLVKDAYTQLGPGWEFPQKIKGCLEQAGCVDVQEEMIPLHLGAKNSDKEMGDTGFAVIYESVESLVETAGSMPGISLTAEQLDGLPARFKSEVEERGACMPMRVVWGRKPL